MGYEDLNDQQRLRLDPLLATACDKEDPLGMDRLNPANRGIALAAPCTLNRLELSNNKQSRCHKLPHDPQKVEACLLKMGVRCLPKHAEEEVVDLDAMGHLGGTLTRITGIIVICLCMRLWETFPCGRNCAPVTPVPPRGWFRPWRRS